MTTTNMCAGSGRPVGAGSRCAVCDASFGYPHPANLTVGRPAPEHAERDRAAERRAAVLAAEAAPCGAGYPDADIACTLPHGHDGDHTTPTGDGDGVWAWAR